MATPEPVPPAGADLFDAAPSAERFQPPPAEDPPALPPWNDSTRWVDAIAARSATRWNAAPGWVDPVAARPAAPWPAPATDRLAREQEAGSRGGLVPLPASDGFGGDARRSAHGESGGMSAGLSRLVEELVAWFKTLCSAAVYATLIVTFGFQVARVEGQSMAPTLADQDRLIVNKLIYRLDKPHRGDVVMLYYPLNPDKSFVKRVIAEEGDQVRIVDGRVYVNETAMSDEFVPAEYRSHDDYSQVVVPEGFYFVMGDHRNNSSDSRHWGYVPKKYIIGKVQLRWWPLPEARIF